MSAQLLAMLSQRSPCDPGWFVTLVPSRAEKKSRRIGRTKFTSFPPHELGPIVVIRNLATSSFLAASARARFRADSASRRAARSFANAQLVTHKPRISDAATAVAD